MTVAAALEHAGFRRQNGRLSNPLVAPGWAPVTGDPRLPAGLTYTPADGHVLRALIADREQVMVGWAQVSVPLKNRWGDVVRCRTRRVTAWRYVVTEHDARRVDLYLAQRREVAAGRERRRAERRLRELA